MIKAHNPALDPIFFRAPPLITVLLELLFNYCYTYPPLIEILLMLMLASFLLKKELSYS